MDRAPITVLNSGIKACADCAHFMPEKRECAAAPMVNKVTGASEFKDAMNERIWGCGAQAIHFIPSDQARAAYNVRRIHLQQSIEKAIMDLNPDTEETSDLLDAISASLTGRYGAAYEDGVEHDLKDLQKALGKVQPFQGIEA